MSISTAAISTASISSDSSFVGTVEAVGLAVGTGAATASSPVIPSTITTTAVAGTRLYIGGHDAFLISPDSAPWIEIGNVFTIGPYRGINFTKVNLESIGDGYTRKLKGSAFAPPFDVVLNRDDTDSGQIALQAALSDRNFMWNFKIEESDTLTVLARTYFRGQVFAFATKEGSANDVKRINALIEVNPSTIINT